MSDGGWGCACCCWSWIFHAIFLNDGRLGASQHGLEWDQLPRGEQWHLAWTKGPQDLWRQTMPWFILWACLLSLALVGWPCWLGVVRWRMVLEAQGLALAMWAGDAHFAGGAVFQFVPAGLDRRRFDQGLLRGARNASQKTEAVTTVFVDRLVGLWAMLFFAGIMMLPNVRDAKEA